MTGYHHIPRNVFDGLSSTYGGPRSIAVLRDARHSKLTLFLTGVLHDRAHTTGDLLIRMERTHPATTMDLLLYPWIGAWLAQVLVRPWTPSDDDYLTGIGIAAAIHGGQISPEAAPAGRTMPSIGTAEGAAVRTAWTGEAHPGLGIVLDDVDPQRYCFQLPMSGRLSDDDVRAWRGRVAGAFDLLAAHDPVRHGELVAGLRAIAPLDPTAPQGRSATHRYAFGGFATGLPETDEEFAAIAIHEFQHSKLNALMDVVKLCEPGPERYFAPWRADARPLIGIVHGVYSFAAMAIFWDALREAPGLAARATVQAADHRLQVRRALQEIEDAPGLTDTGRRFVSGIGAAMATNERDVPADVLRSAGRRLDRIEQAWRRRNA